jgi:hypothetical protein
MAEYRPIPLAFERLAAEESLERSRALLELKARIRESAEAEEREFYEHRARPR